MEDRGWRHPLSSIIYPLSFIRVIFFVVTGRSILEKNDKGTTGSGRAPQTN